ncbi:hypothetical protein JZ751_027609, partial [Albula glossodonta]
MRGKKEDYEQPGTREKQRGRGVEQVHQRQTPPETSNDSSRMCGSGLELTPKELGVSWSQKAETSPLKAVRPSGPTVILREQQSNNGRRVPSSPTHTIATRFYSLSFSVPHIELKRFYSLSFSVPHIELKRFYSLSFFVPHIELKRFYSLSFFVPHIELKRFYSLSFSVPHIELKRFYSLSFSVPHIELKRFYSLSFFVPHIELKRFYSLSFSVPHINLKRFYSLSFFVPHINLKRFYSLSFSVPHIELKRFYSLSFFVPHIELKRFYSLNCTMFRIYLCFSIFVTCVVSQEGEEPVSYTCINNFGGYFCLPPNAQIFISNNDDPAPAAPEPEPEPAAPAVQGERTQQQGGSQQVHWPGRTQTVRCSAGFTPDEQNYCR